MELPTFDSFFLPYFQGSKLILWPILCNFREIERTVIIIQHTFITFSNFGAITKEWPQGNY